jgi:hypothetical protein
MITLNISPIEPTIQQICLAFGELEQLGKKYRADLAENQRLDALSTYQLIDEIFVNYAINQHN